MKNIIIASMLFAASFAACGQDQDHKFVQNVLRKEGLSVQDTTMYTVKYGDMIDLTIKKSDVTMFYKLKDGYVYSVFLVYKDGTHYYYGPENI
jgi:hypothetical protein